MNVKRNQETWRSKRSKHSSAPSRAWLLAGLSAPLVFALACSSSPSTLNGTGGASSGSAGTGGASSGSAGTGGKTGTGTGTGGDLGFGGNPGTGTGGAMSCDPNLPAVVRDFQASHPDFEAFLGVDPGIVQSALGSDKKPVYAGNPTTPTTTGQANFDQWYRDTVGVNIPIPLTIALTDNGNGTYTFDNQAFFPIDGQGFGNEGNPHNYHFTLEMHTNFIYKGGEVFTFTGDDDLFTFINGKLAIDLGGVHGSMSATVDLDAEAAKLGIVKGNQYPIDFFFAERHTVESHFRIDTTIGCFTPPSIPQ